MAGTMKNEYMSLYRHAMIEAYQNDGASMKEATAMYREHSKDIEITKMSSPEIRDMTVDRMLNTNGLDWNTVKNSYMADTRNPDMATRVADEVHDLAQNQAYYEAAAGNWNTQNNQFLSDSQRDEIANLEHEAADERADARYEAEVLTPAPAEPAVADPTWTIQMSKKGEPYVNAKMEVNGEERDVHFKQTYGNHTLEDAEIKQLLQGESISIESRSGNPMSVKLGETKYMGREGFGLVRDDLPEKGARRLPEVPEAAGAEKQDEQSLG